VQGLLSGFAFWLIDIDAYVFWGVVMGFLSVIPFIGPIVIWLPVAVYFGLSGEYWQVVFLAVWFWVVVASVDNVLRPILIGSDTRMPDVLVLLTTLGGLFTFGAIGLVLGPLIGALLMAAWEVYRRTFAAELALSPAAFTGLDGAHAPPVGGSVSESSTAD
jgi:predicted PurR-regulated permease PerM